MGNWIIVFYEISFLISGERKTREAKIKRGETKRKTRGQGSQRKGKIRSQKEAWPWKTGKASWKGEKREGANREEGEGRKGTLGKEGKERGGKKETRRRK